MYWYSDSVSKSERLISGGGTTSNAARTTGATIHARPASSAAPRPTSDAVATSVLCVPIQGIATSAARNVPARLPAVESAYRRPATRPASATRAGGRGTRDGAAAPGAAVGRANSARGAEEEPAATPA